MYLGLKTSPFSFNLGLTVNLKLKKNFLMEEIAYI